MTRLPRFTIDKTTLDVLKIKARHVATWLARTSLPEILFVSTFVISHFLPNADFSYPYELLLPLALLAVLVSIFYYAYRLVFRRVLTAHIAALPLSYYIYHYEDLSRHGHAVIGRMLPDAVQTPFTLSMIYMFGAAILFGLVAYAAVKLAALRPKLALDSQLTKIALFIITFNFVVQAVVLGNFMFRTRHQLAYEHQSKTPARKADTAVKKPDIYYLLFDRYTNAEALKNVYGYDNSDMLDFLAGQQFVTRDKAYANYPYTMASVSSTLAMDYEPELARFASDSKQTGFPYRSILNNPPVIDLLKQNGYEYNLLSSWWDFARIGVKADKEPTKSFRLHLLGHDFYQSDFSRDIINRSVLSPILKKGIGVKDLYLAKYDLDRNPSENFAAQMAALKEVYQTKSDTPQFTFAHILLPHDPYIFNPDGSETSYSHDRNDEGEDEYVKYTNQLTYANTRIKELVTAIKAASPDAVIVLQSDEGPYPKEFRGPLTEKHYFDPKNLPVEHMQQKMGVLASYYLPGVPQEEIAANMNSNVNAFRFILSRYMGYELPSLPDCHFSMGNKFDLFSYTLLTKRLTGEDATAQCNKYLR